LSNEAVIFVTSFLLVTLIYDQINNLEVSARPPKHIDNLCRDATPTAPGAVTAQVCCQVINGAISVCTKCQYDADGKDVGGCINFYPERQMPGGNSTLPPTSAGASLSSSGNNTGLKTNGQTGPPNHLGSMLHSSGNNTNTRTPPASTVTKEHNPSAPKLFSSTSKPTNPSNNNQQTSGISSSNPSSSSAGKSSSSGSDGSSSSSSGSGSHHHHH
jgi:hypothetical protein